MSLRLTVDAPRGHELLTRLERALEHEGHAPSHTRDGKLDDAASLAILRAHDAPNHWEVWCLDKLHDSLSSLLRGEGKLALRCLGTAREYKGRMGGYWPRFEAAESAAAFVEQALEEQLGC